MKKTTFIILIIIAIVIAGAGLRSNFYMHKGDVSHNAPSSPQDITTDNQQFISDYYLHLPTFAEDSGVVYLHLDKSFLRLISQWVKTSSTATTNYYLDHLTDFRMVAISTATIPLDDVVFFLSNSPKKINHDFRCGIVFVFDTRVNLKKTLADLFPGVAFAESNGGEFYGAIYSSMDLSAKYVNSQHNIIEMRCGAYALPDSYTSLLSNNPNFTSLIQKYDLVVTGTPSILGRITERNDNVYMVGRMILGEFTGITSYWWPDAVNQDINAVAGQWQTIDQILSYIVHLDHRFSQWADWVVTSAKVLEFSKGDSVSLGTVNWDYFYVVNNNISKRVIMTLYPELLKRGSITYNDGIFNIHTSYNGTVFKYISYRNQQYQINNITLQDPLALRLELSQNKCHLNLGATYIENSTSTLDYSISLGCRR